MQIELVDQALTELQVKYKLQEEIKRPGIGLYKAGRLKFNNRTDLNY